VNGHVRNEEPIDPIRNGGLVQIDGQKDADDYFGFVFNDGNKNKFDENN
jgi:hypothetical protein